ncbi:MAG TPA: DUF3667 domain-containing protein [Terriglobales bacterium]|nr:DUF3667 domain-containing protein [Terriglobales bacterium]
MSAPVSSSPIDRADACANCAYPAPGTYCPGCGEEQPGHHDLSLSHFFHEVFHEFVHLDSRLFRTLKALLFQPGFLTAEYFAGRKARYFRPLRLYLVIFALSLFVFTLYRPISIYDFNRIMEQQPAGGPLDKAMARSAAKLHTTVPELSERISQKWQRNLPFVQLLYVLLLAGTLKLIFLGTGRYYVEHLVFSLHYYSFNFLFGIILWPLYYISGGLDPFGRTLWVTVLSYCVHVSYMFLALRRFYPQTTVQASYRTLIVVMSSVIMFAIAIVVALLAAFIQVLR